jgi:hypothetical protein
MLKRLWWVLSVLWAFVFIANGLTKEHGLQAPDIAIAGAPLVGAAALAAIARYVVTGRWRARKYRVY